VRNKITFRKRGLILQLHGKIGIGKMGTGTNGDNKMGTRKIAVLGIRTFPVWLSPLSPCVFKVHKMEGNDPGKETA